MHARILFMSAFIMSFQLFAQNVPYTLDKKNSSISFTASTWMFSVSSEFSDWDAVGTKTGDKLTDFKVVITIKTTSFNTRNSNRDKHLRNEDFFWVEKYPTATFESTQITQKPDKSFTVKGNLTLRGKTKPIEFDSHFEQDGKSYRVFGDAIINRKDFDINHPGLPLMKIYDDVKVHFDVRGTGN